jgi:hypothetical protein
MKCVTGATNTRQECDVGTEMKQCVSRNELAQGCSVVDFYFSCGVSSGITTTWSVI